MGFFGYNFNIPNAPNDPSDDQPQMLINTVSIGNLIAVDHIGFSNANGGYHTVIHQGNAPGNTDPANITNIGQLYVKTVTLNSVMDQQLFFESGQGIITQLTSGIANSPATNGYVFLPGGILLQWGSITGGLVSGTTTPLLFATANINFPANCFNVSATLINAGGTNNAQTISIRSGSVSKTGFSWNYSGGSAYTGFYWTAIGN